MKFFTIFTILFLNILPIAAQQVSREQQQIDSLLKLIEQLKTIDALKNQLKNFDDGTNKQNQKVDTTSKAVQNNPNQPIVSVNSKSELNFTSEQLTQFENKAIELINELTNQINIIGYKPNSTKKKDDAIAYAMDLFSSEENTVEVRSVKNPNAAPITRKIREYLNRVKLIAYSDIKFTAYGIHITNELKKGENGWYYGVATYCQKFEYDLPTASLEKLKSYSRKQDITCRDIQIIVREEDSFGEKIWRVFLGDISVVDYNTK
jgi:hypothetical protein